MSASRLDTLLERLCSGDADAAEQVFLAYEPYLRVVIRRQISPQLRAKFDSVDVVQSVWADVVEGIRQSGWRFHDTSHLRAFLVKLTRNRFIDRLRENQTALKVEQSLDAIEPDVLPPSRHPRPSEIAQADELWNQLLAICPPNHREMLRLKREGRSLREIVERTGLHEGSIRRILRKLARQVAFRL